MRSFYQELRDILHSGSSLVLATIINKNESSSREAGTKMIIKEDFSIIGTLGGGIFEAMAIMLSREVFESRAYIIKKFDIENSDPGMICGIGMTVSLEFVDASDESTLGYYNKMSEYSELQRNLIMATKYINNQEIIREVLFEEDYFRLDNNLREKLSDLDFLKTKFAVIQEEDGISVYNPLFNVESVYIFGAGHIGKKLAQITKMLDYYTVVLDDRREFANRERIPEADSLIVLDSFRNIKNYINIEKNSYIIIVTRGHVDDMEVLGEVVRTNARYIGMIGSKKKRDAIYEELMGRGFLKEELSRVHCPIGVDIKAKTPEEITISIAAELIKARRSGYE